MDISLGFLTLFILVLLPGLIFRRLYFYGEFSKQFNSEHSLVSLVAVASIPGIILLISVYFAYDHFVSEINLEGLVNTYKKITSNNELDQAKDDTEKLNDILKLKVFPFIGYLYSISILFGAISGRIVRIFKLDTRFKLLRFKNYWFYLFNGQHGDFKKMRYLKQGKSKKHLFTMADILIDTNSQTCLYSGVVVDYELNSSDCSLSKVILRDAERYRKDSNTNSRVRTPIPGTFLIVDCTSLKNINLTYVYEDRENYAIKSRLPYTIEVLFGILSLLLIPAFIFKSESVNWQLYDWYFGLVWYKKILAYFFVTQILALFIPYRKEKDEYKYVNVYTIMGKLIYIVILYFLIS